MCLHRYGYDTYAACGSRGNVRCRAYGQSMGSCVDFNHYPHITMSVPASTLMVTATTGVPNFQPADSPPAPPPPFDPSPVVPVGRPKLSSILDSQADLCSALSDAMMSDKVASSVHCGIEIVSPASNRRLYGPLHTSASPCFWSGYSRGCRRSRHCRRCTLQR